MTNEVLQAIAARRSCRSYEPRQITKEELDAVAQAGTWAPSAMGRQAGKIVVVQDPETVAQLERMNAAVLGDPNAHPFYGAPTVLVVFADSTIPTYVQDGSLVLGNLQLAASAIGLGSCWINRAKEAFETDEGRALMKKWGVGEQYAGVGNCILGYVKGELPAPAPRKADYIIYT